MSRTDAARNRATHVKLTRDFRRVEATFNKLNLDLKQRRDLVEARRAQEEDERRFKAEASSGEQAMRLEMQLKEDVSSYAQLFLSAFEEFKSVSCRFSCMVFNLIYLVATK